MAAATYATDLTPITAAESGSFTEFTGYTAGTLSTVPETDYFIQNTGCVSSTVKTVLNSIGFDFGSGVTVPTDGAVFFWQFFAAPTSLDTFANGGQRCLIGTSITNFKAWKSGGKDYPPNPYGGWKNVAIDPTVTQDYTGGTGGTTYQVFGIAVALPSTYPSKGAPFGMDAIRYGRGEARVNGGDITNGYATFLALAAANDAIAARWGLFQEVSGGYLWKGLLTLGYTSAIDFRDSNRTILVDDCPRAKTNFTKIEIRQATSRVDWTGCSFQALGTTVKGRVEVIDDCDVNVSKCTFVGMDTFVLKAATDILDSEFRGCGIITANSAKLTGTKVSGFEGTADSSALVWDTAINPNGKLDNMVFTKGTAATHAITFGTTSPTEMTLTGVTFSGYNASNSQNDSAIYVARTTGTVTITVVGGTTPSYKSAGAIVSITSAVNVTLTGLKVNSEVRVFLQGTTTEVAGTGAEDIDDGDHTFSIASGTAVDIAILCLGYQNLRILNYSTTANATIPVAQVLDRQYWNG